MSQVKSFLWSPLRDKVMEKIWDGRKKWCCNAITQNFCIESLHSLPKHLRSLAKVLHFLSKYLRCFAKASFPPEILCIRSQNFCVLYSKTVAFPLETLRSLAKLLSYFAKYYISLWNFTFFCEIVAFSCSAVFLPRDFAFAYKTFTCSCKSIEFPLETWDLLASTLCSLAKVLRSPVRLCSLLQSFCVYSEHIAFAWETWLFFTQIFCCLTNILLFPEKLCIRSWNICVPLQKYCIFPKTFVVGHKTFVFSSKSIAFPWETWHKSFAFFHKSIAFPWESRYFTVICFPEKHSNCFQHRHQSHGRHGKIWNILH